jgi:hypothetical protein
MTHETCATCPGSRQTHSFALALTPNHHLNPRTLAQPCLGGHGKTLMLCNVNAEPASAQETLCSLKFAAKVNGCETGAKGGAKRNVAAVAAAAVGGAGGSGNGAAGGLAGKRAPSAPAVDPKDQKRSRTK